ncbi:competence/damage-inducible protein A [Candidatus Methylopumilus turicensis]|uniref:Molybdopterin binding domain protein n=1 Tax=Candidatus Methylopumilus turicensis TaxID=1581680 RepID=A0A0B7IY41_9PROT|nr:molybdopterin-binding protein [Candidatus Methylopumilus turicensis]CEN55346.1 Molybdopterin binding domain protein [Candidatus Methylopumilus turicensis]
MMTKDIPNIGIYVIGDEILSGKRQDAHLSKAIEILKARGLQLSWAEYLGDDPARLVASFKRSLATNDIVFSFGGIGATPDDFTRQAAAEAINVPIERHAGAVAEIEAQFGEAAYPKRVLMADFPKGADLIPNPVNRIAGFSVKQHYFMPGFPQMSHPMMEWVLDTHYQHFFHQVIISELSILVMDAGESSLLDFMNEMTSKYPQLKLFSLPRLDTRRTIELGMKGDLTSIDTAMSEIKEKMTVLGYAWSELPK